MLGKRGDDGITELGWELLLLAEFIFYCYYGYNWMRGNGKSGTKNI
jgi:hypothetical protein